MINKIVATLEEAVSGIRDGFTIMLGGFAQGGRPVNLVEALVNQGAKNLTVICNSISQAAPLVEKKRVAKLIASFPLWVDPSRHNPLEEQLDAGEIELEMVPQGTLAERIRAGGADIAAFYIPVGIGTVVEEGKEKRIFGGKEYLLEPAHKADVALIKGYQGDRMGNLIYRFAARNFNPIMAMAADLVIAEVEEIVEVGALAPDVIVTPGIYVDRLVKAPKRVEWLFKPVKD